MAQLEAFNKDKAENFQENALDCSEMIEDLRDELSIFKEDLLKMAEDVERLNKDFKNEKELLEQAAEEAEEDFDLSRNPNPQRDQ